MKRFWMAGLVGAAIVSGSMVTAAARAADEKRDEMRRPGRRTEVRRMIGSGGGLGVSLEDADGGVVVADVYEGSAADKAGVREGDVIVRFAGEAVRSAAHLARLVRETPRGRSVDFEVTRGGSPQKLSATLKNPELFSFGRGRAEDFHFEMPELPDIPERPELPELAGMPEPPMPPLPPSGPYRFRLGQGSKLGISYQELGGQLARYFGVDGGVLVTDVQESGPAASAGIKAGDVIVRIGTHVVKDGGDLREAIRDAASGSKATVVVQRDKRSMDLSVTLGARS